MVYILFPLLFIADTIFMSDQGLFIFFFIHERDTLYELNKSLKYMIILVSERAWMTFLLLILDAVVFALVLRAQLLLTSVYC